jgi:hypothetical protein
MTTAFPSGEIRAPRMSVVFMNSSREMGGLLGAAGEVCALVGSPATIRIESKSADAWVDLIEVCNGSTGVGKRLHLAQKIQPAERA